MRPIVFCVFLIMTAGCVLHAKGEDRLDTSKLSKTIIARENGRLEKAIQTIRNFMKIARVTASHSRRLKHSIAQKQLTIEANTMILNTKNEKLLIVSAQAIVHGELDRNYAALMEIHSEPEKHVKTYQELMATQKSLTDELNSLKEGYNKLNAPDQK